MDIQRIVKLFLVFGTAGAACILSLYFAWVFGLKVCLNCIKLCLKLCVSFWIYLFFSHTLIVMVFGYTFLNLWIPCLKGINHGRFFICIKLGILSLCTEPWNGTSSISISWDFCLYWKAIWWIEYVYRYWL